MTLQGLPTIRSYGDYASSNYGAHALEVTVGSLTVYFSYTTPIAFRGPNGLRCSENCWSTTTGKHLNWIEPNKKARLPRAKFEQEFKETLATLGLSAT